MNKQEILTITKKQSIELRDFFVDELRIHRESGNFKYELTPKDVQNAYMKGVTNVLNMLNIE